AVSLEEIRTIGTTVPLIDNQAAGVDTIQFAGLSGITFDLNLTTQTVGGDVSVTLLGTFERVIGTPGNDKLIGNGAANYLYGAGGNDTPVAGSGNATLEGGAGNDSLVGGTGATTYRFAGSNLGSDIVAQPLNTQSDTLDFGQLSGPATVSIDPSQANVA